MGFQHLRSAAHFSRCGRYRYALWRAWDDGLASVMLIGLNPSTADATHNDPTIRRCIGFARDWGFGSLWVVNLFAFRAVQPKVLMSENDPIGPRNDLWLRKLARRSDRIVAAWGNHGRFMDRSNAVHAMFEGRLDMIRMNASGEPAHPLYLPKGLKPRPMP